MGLSWSSYKSSPCVLDFSQQVRLILRGNIPKDQPRRYETSYSLGSEAAEHHSWPILLVTLVTKTSPDSRGWKLDSSSWHEGQHTRAEKEETGSGHHWILSTQMPKSYRIFKRLDVNYYVWELWCVKTHQEVLLA